MTGPVHAEDGAPCEPRFFVRAGWLAAIPLAWAASLALVLAFQGFSGATLEARGPAHVHAHDGTVHAHEQVAHHHHGLDAGAIPVGEDTFQAIEAGRSASGGFDLIPAPLAFARPAVFRSRPIRIPGPFASGPVPSLPERPPLPHGSTT